MSAGLKRSGYDEVALTSLSTADFSGIDEVVSGIIDDPTNCGQVSVSLPSLRVDAFTVQIAASIQKARRTGLTFAPEAGTWRMRQVINKLIAEEDLYAAVESAFSQGWRRMKLYFLTGLPTETDEDTLGIIELARKCVELGRAHHRNPSVTVSVGDFVPKPQTPFQWFGQNTIAELQRKFFLLRDEARKHRGVELKFVREVTDGSATSSNRFGERAVRSKNGLNALNSIAGRMRWPNMGSTLIGMSIAIGPRARSCHGITCPQGSTRSFSGRTGPTPSPRWGLRTAVGLRATTVEPVRATRLSTSSPRPCRQRVAVREPASAPRSRPS